MNSATHSSRGSRSRRTKNNEPYFRGWIGILNALFSPCHRQPSPASTDGWRCAPQATRTADAAGRASGQDGLRVTGRTRRERPHTQRAREHQILTVPDQTGVQPERALLQRGWAAPAAAPAVGPAAASRGGPGGPGAGACRFGTGVLKSPSSPTPWIKRCRRASHTCQRRGGPARFVRIQDTPCVPPVKRSGINLI